jgi:hypothetical protein
MALPSTEPIGAQGLTTAHLISAIPDFVLSGIFLITWIAPDALGEKMVSYLMLVMLMEFINVHAAGFMGKTIISDADPRKKALSIVGLGLLYTLFVGAFAFLFKVWWPLLAFWGLILNRLLGILLGKTPTEAEKNALQASWSVGVFAYVMLVFATIMIPIPSLGVDAVVIARQNLGMKGLWIDQPYRMMAFGFLYFAAIGFFELYSFKWIKPGSNVIQFFRRS